MATASSSVWICTRSLADAGLERLRSVQRDDPSLVDDRDAVAVLGLVHVVRGHEDRDVLTRSQLANVAPDRGARLRVEPDRRLVRNSTRGECIRPRAISSRRFMPPEKVLTLLERRSHNPTMSSTWRRRESMVLRGMPYSSACNRRLRSAVR